MSTIKSKHQAQQLLKSSQFINSYGNYELQSDEAKKWLSDNKFNLKSGTYVGIEALTGFIGGNGLYGARDRYARPELVCIYYNIANLPDWVEADYSSEEYKKLQKRKVKNLESQLESQLELAKKVEPMTLLDLAQWDPLCQNKPVEDINHWQALYNRIISAPSETKKQIENLQ